MPSVVQQTGDYQVSIRIQLGRTVEAGLVDARGKLSLAEEALRVATADQQSFDETPSQQKCARLRSCAKQTMYAGMQTSAEAKELAVEKAVG